MNWAEFGERAARSPMCACLKPAAAQSTRGQTRAAHQSRASGGRHPCACQSCAAPAPAPRPPTARRGAQAGRRPRRLRARGHPSCSEMGQSARWVRQQARVRTQAASLMQLASPWRASTLCFHFTEPPKQPPKQRAGAAPSAHQCTYRFCPWSSRSVRSASSSRSLQGHIRIRWEVSRARRVRSLQFKRLAAGECRSPAHQPATPNRTDQGPAGPDPQWGSAQSPAQCACAAARRRGAAAAAGSGRDRACAARPPPLQAGTGSR